MATFEITKTPLQELLREIKEGKIQLPNFQRGWVWDDNHIRDLLVSIARSFPIGAVMLLEAGGKVHFETRPVEGLEDELSNNRGPEKLILDGQQRLTTLTQALFLDEPVRTRTTVKGRQMKRHYYFDINKALKDPSALDEAIVAVDENKQLRSNFGRDVDLDLSTREMECKRLFFPCNQTMNSASWEYDLIKVSPSNHVTYMNFRERILEPFRRYLLPVILLNKETSKEAVCLIFEKVNTGGVQLTVFDLITASYAAEGYNLRDDWVGSNVRNVQSRRERLGQDKLLEGIDAPEFLQAICLLRTHELEKPVSAKRTDVLQLSLDAWRTWADDLEEGFRQVANFLRKQCFYSRRELPYITQLIPLAAVFTHLGDRWREPRIYDKMVRWFWSGALGELYSGAVETRIANDYEEMLHWIDDDKDKAQPGTVRDANFQLDRFDTLRSRLSAAYKAVNALVLRNGSKDWFWKASIKELDDDGKALEIHHIFPRTWCEKQGISRDRYDSILNKTPISSKANRMIGGEAPSRYLSKIQQDEQVRLSPSEMDKLLASHAISPDLLRQDDFEGFLEDRRKQLSKLVEQAMGKRVQSSDF